MEQVAFFIDKISYGWFDDSYKGSDWQVAISASDAWGTDAPALLLQGLIQQRNADIPAPLYVIIDYDFFLHSVYRAFLQYENTVDQNQYEKHWMPFPVKQWNMIAALYNK